MANGLLILEQTNFIKLAFVRALQVALAHESTPAEYRYSQVESERQVSIFRAYPKRTTKLPAIIVSADAADVSIKTLGEEIIEEEYDTNTGKLMSRTYGGVMFIPVTLTILAKTTTDRERLTDLISIYARFVFRPWFALQNLEYLDIRGGDDGEEAAPAGSETLYKGKITIQCQTEFKQVIDMSIFDAVSAIDLSGLRYGTDSSDLTPVP